MYIFLLCKVAFNKMKISRHGEMSAARTRGKVRCIAITASGVHHTPARKYNYFACVKPP